MALPFFRVKNSLRQALGASQDFSASADSMVRSAGLSLYHYPQAQVPREKTVPPPDGYRKKLLSSVETLPPLPTVLNQLLKVMNDANSSVGQISALIEKDGVLSGNVLRCVNSAYYGLQSRVSSIRHAVTLLGFETLRNLALAFSMRRMLVKPRPSSRKLSSQYSQHALACAIMTQFLAHYTKSQDVDAAFAAGLFHDVGKLERVVSEAPGRQDFSGGGSETAWRAFLIQRVEPSRGAGEG